MNRARPRRRGGFTLMEVLLVLAILVILGSLAGVMISNAQKRADLDAAKSQVGSFDTALGTYLVTMKEYPSSQSGLQALRTPPADAMHPDRWMATLDREVPMDPWGHPYMYSQPGSHNPDKYDVWSMGPDGQDGTDDDIGNW